MTVTKKLHIVVFLYFRYLRYERLGDTKSARRFKAQLTRVLLAECDLYEEFTTQEMREAAKDAISLFKRTAERA